MSLSLSRLNYFICLNLLSSLQHKGLEHIVLCPGSRSAPLALAVGFLGEEKRISFYNAIDERSAGFLALGISAASGKAAAVITTSGTAVSNLLPAAVEADRSCCPIIFITADRPSRLKDCGANQTVNQEAFLKSVCRIAIQGPENGAHTLNSKSLERLVNKIWNSSNDLNGPVHLNLPIEEPLYPSFEEQKEVCNEWEPNDFHQNDLDQKNKKIKYTEYASNDFPDLDPNKEGLIIVGPYRGKPNDLESYTKAIIAFQKITDWPVFADILSGVIDNLPGRIDFWELLISSNKVKTFNDMQILRLGPMPSSRSLENYLKRIKGKQVLITEKDTRYLDPLRMSRQYSGGINSWLNTFKYKHIGNKIDKKRRSQKQYLSEMLFKNKQVLTIIDNEFKNAKGIAEPSIPRFMLNFLPSDIPIMLSASSPVRDFLTYSGSKAFSRRCFSFRGASGIDGNISLAIGLSIILGPLVLLCGDLALLHDCYALSLAQPSNNPLIILLIDNAGGGIFKQLNLENIYKGDFENLFAMPQVVDHESLAKAYKIPFRQVSSISELREAFNWGMQFTGSVLIRIPTDSENDSSLRKNIIESLEKYIN